MEIHEFKLEKVQTVFLKDIDHQINSWLQNIFDEVWEKNKEVIQELKLDEKEKLLRTHLQEKINHSVEEQLSKHAAKVIQSFDLDDQIIALLQNDLSFFIRNFRVTIPTFFNDEDLKYKNIPPLLATTSIIILFFAGLFLGKEVRLPELGALVFTTFGVYLLFLLQQKIIVNPKSFLARKMTFFLSSTAKPKNDFERWKNWVQDYLLNHIKAIYENMAVLFWLLARMYLENETSPKADTLQTLFEKCQDGLAEVFFAEMQQEDPERALDACIKLISNIESAGVKAEIVNEGTVFKEDLEALFTTFGRIKDADPVKMVYPAWLYGGKVLVKGKIKRKK